MNRPYNPRRLTLREDRRSARWQLFWFLVWLLCAVVFAGLVYVGIVRAQDVPPSETILVCFRTSATPSVQLGCVPRASFLPVTGTKFTVDGTTFDVRETLPPSTAQFIPGRRFPNGDALLLAAVEIPPNRPEGINFIAALRLTRAQLPAAADVIPRAVDADGDTAERVEPLRFAAPAPINPKPKAPALILIDELQAALDRARAQIAAQQ